MKIEIVKTGYLEENCYILSKNSKCLIIDPGDDFENIEKISSRYELVAILITHNHFDHVGALKEFISKYNPIIYDRNNLKEKEYKIDCFKFFVIYTPGHTMDSISYYFKDDKALFVGDFIFKGSIGRTDLGGNKKEMINSINKIKKYPNDIIIYPGHGDKTTLDYEIKNNVYFLQ